MRDPIEQRMMSTLIEQGMDPGAAHEAIVASRGVSPPLRLKSDGEQQGGAAFVIDFDAAVRWFTDHGYTRATAEEFVKSTSFRASSGIGGRESMPGGKPDAMDVVRAHEQRTSPRGAPKDIPNATATRDVVVDGLVKANMSADEFEEAACALMRLGSGGGS